ncbi:hypothetical protein CYMTET_36277, partial [Cymbomonas tetramitiformis]
MLCCIISIVLLNLLLFGLFISDSSKDWLRVPQCVGRPGLYNTSGSGWCKEASFAAQLQAAGARMRGCAALVEAMPARCAVHPEEAGCCQAWMALSEAKCMCAAHRLAPQLNATLASLFPSTCPIQFCSEQPPAAGSFYDDVRSLNEQFSYAGKADSDGGGESSSVLDASQVNASAYPLSVLYSLEQNDGTWRWAEGAWWGAVSRLSSYAAYEEGASEAEAREYAEVMGSSEMWYSDAAAGTPLAEYDLLGFGAGVTSVEGVTHFQRQAELLASVLEGEERIQKGATSMAGTSCKDWGYYDCDEYDCDYSDSRGWYFAEGPLAAARALRSALPDYSLSLEESDPAAGVLDYQIQ